MVRSMMFSHSNGLRMYTRDWAEESALKNAMESLNDCETSPRAPTPIKERPVTMEVSLPNWKTKAATINKCTTVKTEPPPSPPINTGN